MTAPTPLDRATLSRRVWLTGGILLVAWALAGLAMPILAGLPWLTRVLFAAAALVFALGWRGEGSVTARRPLGTIALILLGIWPWITDLLWVLFPQSVTYVPLSSFTPFSFLWVIELLLAIIVVTQIARAGVVPTPWSWAPLAALAAVVLTQVGMALFATTTFDQVALTAAMGIVSFVHAAAVAALGIIAIVLAVRAVDHAEA